RDDDRLRVGARLDTKTLCDALLEEGAERRLARRVVTLCRQGALLRDPPAARRDRPGGQRRGRPSSPAFAAASPSGPAHAHVSIATPGCVTSRSPSVGLAAPDELRTTPPSAN